MKQNVIKVKNLILASNLIKAIVLNAIVLIALLLFFKPTLKSDDYYLSEIIYGAVSGEYDVHLVYNNILLGYFTKALLEVFPNVAWFSVLQIAFLFFAFIILTYWILSNRTTEYKYFISVIILLVFGYECYIRLTFTKTAGILIAVGLLVVLDAIKQNKIRSLLFVSGITSVFVGILYRKATLSSVLAFLIGIVIIEVICKIGKKEYKHAIKKFLAYMTVFLCVFMGSTFVTKLNNYLYSNDSQWNNYYYMNSLKSKIVDYTTNNYESQSEEYNKIGISENDLNLIYSNDLYDLEYLTEDKLWEVISIAQQSESESFILEAVDIENVYGFLQDVPIEYIRTFSFSAYLILTLFIIINGGKRNYLSCLYTIFIMIGENYYLFLQGRVLQPHVDVVIIFSACLVILNFLEIKEQSSKSKVLIKNVSFLVMLITVLNSFESISAPYFWNYGSENACNPEKSKAIMDVLSRDKDNLYVTISNESVYSKWSFDTFEVIPKNYFSNIYTLGSYPWGSHRIALERYNVKNIYKELVNADNIYFFVSDDLEDKGVNSVLTYINEHYDKKAEFEKVQEIDYINIYRCISS